LLASLPAVGPIARGIAASGLCAPFLAVPVRACYRRVAIRHELPLRSTEALR
jgi:hypothetical protein